MQELFLTDSLDYDVRLSFVAEIKFLTVSHTSSLPLTSSTFLLHFMVFYQNCFPYFYFDITILTILGISFAILPSDLHATELI